MPSPTAKTRFLSTLAKKSWKPEPVPNIPTNHRRSDIAQTFIAIPTGYIPKMREMPRVGEWNSRNLIILKTTKITPPSTLEWLMDALLPLINFSLFFNPEHSYSKYLAYWFFWKIYNPNFLKSNTYADFFAISQKERLVFIVLCFVSLCKDNTFVW